MLHGKVAIARPLCTRACEPCDSTLEWWFILFPLQYNELKNFCEFVKVIRT